MCEMKQTGRKRYRVGWFGKVILQIEWTWYELDTMMSVGTDVTQWRDARAQDVMEVA